MMNRAESAKFRHVMTGSKETKLSQETVNQVKSGQQEAVLLFRRMLVGNLTKISKAYQIYSLKRMLKRRHAARMVKWLFVLMV